MFLFQIVVDLSGLTQTSFDNPFQAVGFLFAHGAWYALIPLALWGAWEVWLLNRQEKYARSIQYVVLAIDVPKLNEQSPKAAEQIFAHLSGLQRKGNAHERYIQGYVQPAISLELVSIGGYIQYLVRCPAKVRDLVEAAFYAQYPDSEISEIQDYVPVIKPEFPGKYDLWGAELTLTNKDPYPIKTYPAFEHTLSQKFIDPMASLLEIMSRLKPGEQIWLQVVITPTLDNAWRDVGLRIIKKLIGAKVKASQGGLLAYPGRVGTGVYETLTASLFAPAQTNQRTVNEPPTLLMHLPPHEKNVIEAIGTKISKIGFTTKFRFIYFAETPVYDGSRIGAIFGAIKQFNTLDLNGFKPERRTMTSANYWLVKSRTLYRKKKLYWAYRARSLKRGVAKFVLNTEELATLYHFPVIEVKAPLVKKTEAKRGEPPSSLPLAPESIPPNVPTPPT